MRVRGEVAWKSCSGSMAAGMALNSTVKERWALARKPAMPRGESEATVVSGAAPARPGGLAEALLVIGRDCNARLTEPHRSADPAELLYDEHGMPK